MHFAESNKGSHGGMPNHTCNEDMSRWLDMYLQGREDKYRPRCRCGRFVKSKDSGAKYALR